MMILIRTLPVMMSFCAIILASCSGTGWSTGYSQYGFYSTPDESISEFSSRVESLSAGEHFALAQAYKEKGDLKKAAVHFANSAFVREKNLSLKPYPGPVFSFLKKYAVKSDYYDDAASELSSIFLYYNEFVYAEKLAALVGKNDISLFRESFLVRSKALDAQKKYDESIKTVKDGLAAMPKDELKPVLYIRLASSLKKKNDLDGAVKAYNEVLRISPEGWQAATVGKELLEIMKGGVIPPSFDIFLAAKGLAGGKEYSDAAKLLEKAGNADSGMDAYSLAELKVRVFAGTGRSSEADRIISAYNKTDEKNARLSSVKGDVLWQKGSRAEAVKAYESVLKSGSSYNCKNEHRRVCFYLYENNAAEASVYCERYAEIYPDDNNADKMLWLAAKPFIEHSDAVSARRYLERIITKYPDGDYSGHARFWIWKYLTQEGKKDEAEKIFRAMPLRSGGSVYTWILMNRLKDGYDSASLKKYYKSALSSSDAEQAVFAHAMLFIKDGDSSTRDDRVNELTSRGMNPYKTFNSEVLSLSLSSEYASILKRTEKYFAAGYGEGVGRVFNSLIIPDDETAKAAVEKDKALVQTAFGRKYEHYYSCINGVTGLLENGKLQENVFLFSHEAVDLILPSGFRDLVDKESTRYGIEKSMVYSIIKAESAFNHKAVSGAGAVGLMQLMPPTAKDVSRNTKTPVYDMKIPSDAVRFGTFYLNWLKKYFKGNFRDMVAGYNAGAGNVNKWRKSYSSGDDDLYTEQVPFEETRGYILRTEKYLIQYRLLKL
jgi:tetratricopeptide (TPR) repeat protein